MAEKQNPILKFRTPATAKAESHTYGYDVINGLHYSGDNAVIQGIKTTNLGTMITETREAVGSSEMAG